MNTNAEAEALPQTLSPTCKITDAVHHLLSTDNPFAVFQLCAKRRDGSGMGSGTYCDPDALIKKARKLSQNTAVEAVWIRLQQLRDDFPLSDFQWSNGGMATDADMTSWRFIFVDVDTVASEGKVPSAADKAVSKQDALRVKSLLLKYGVPVTTADSGNGWHLLVPFREDITPETTELVKTFVQAIAYHAEAHLKGSSIDTKVTNPGRLCKLYGSWTRKGTEDILWRCSELKSQATTIATVEQIQNFVDKFPIPVTETSTLTPRSSEFEGEITPVKMEEFLAFYGIRYNRRLPFKGAGTKWLIKDCPIGHHTTPSTSSRTMVSLSEGIPGFKCQTDKCGDYGWKRFREHLESNGRKFSFFPKPTPEPPTDPTPTTSDEWLDWAQEDNTSETMQDAPTIVETPLVTDVIVDEYRYPVEAWDGTAYGEFAELCGKGNHVPREFFIEAIKTVTGSVVGTQISIQKMATQEPRFYTVFIAGGGIGKSTAINRAINVFGDQLLYRGDTSPFQNIGAHITFPASGSALSDIFENHPRVLVHSDEFSVIIEKFAIQGSGGSFLGNINSLYDSCHPIVNVTKGKTRRGSKATEAHLTVIGATTPDKWGQMFTKTGATGSGFLQRLNIIASEEGATVATLYDPDLTGFRDTFLQKVNALEYKPVTCAILPEAEKAMQSEWSSWISQSSDDSDIKGRLNTYIYRNALHMAWLLGPNESGQYEINSDVMHRAIKLAKYEFHARKEHQPVEGDNQAAIVENAVTRILQKGGRMKHNTLYRKINGYRYGQDPFEKAIRSLERVGLLASEKYSTRGPQGTEYWLIEQSGIASRG